MDLQDPTLESKCENLMNIVVESRKRFGKACIDYNQKILLMENKLLNLQVETISGYRFKLKHTIVKKEDSEKDVDDFLIEIAAKQRRLDDLKRKLKNTQKVIMQLESDGVGKRLRAPLTAEAMLANAEAKNI